jgi:hypothetical protein
MALKFTKSDLMLIDSILYNYINKTKFNEVNITEDGIKRLMYLRLSMAKEYGLLNWMSTKQIKVLSKEMADKYINK